MSIHRRKHGRDERKTITVEFVTSAYEITREMRPLRIEDIPRAHVPGTRRNSGTKNVHALENKLRLKNSPLSSIFSLQSRLTTASVRRIYKKDNEVVYLEGGDSRSRNFSPARSHCPIISDSVFLRFFYDNSRPFHSLQTGRSTSQKKRERTRQREGQKVKHGARQRTLFSHLLGGGHKFPQVGRAALRT